MITPLRRRMLEDMQLRNLCPETQRNYVFHIHGLARFYQTSPDQLSLEEICEYQLYLINERRLSPECGELRTLALDPLIARHRRLAAKLVVQDL